MYAIQYIGILVYRYMHILYRLYTLYGTAYKFVSTHTNSYLKYLYLAPQLIKNDIIMTLYRM